MGRLFQYNRLGNADSTRKDNSYTNIYNRKEKHSSSLTCPAYSDLYTGYKISTASKNEICSKENLWINRFLCTDILSEQTISCKANSNQSNQQNNYPNDFLMGTAKRTKVFNCMKDFFKRKILQQQNGFREISKSNRKTWETLNDSTSDYDDVDNVDSSYNADEEDDYEDASDDCACMETRKTTNRTSSTYRKLEKISKPKENSLRSALSFSCWQLTTEADTATASSAASTDTEEQQNSKFVVSNGDISDDAEISDCCQLIVKSPKKSSISCRKIKKTYGKKTHRFRLANANANANDEDEDNDSDECSDLLKASWYQPRITTKAAYERLRQSSPGSFLVRRKSRTFELCLRSETKVKHFTVVGGNETYKLKGAKKQFSSLKALVTHHSVMAEQLPLTLLLPREKQLCTQKSSVHRYDDDFDTFESLKILGILQSLQAKNFDIS